MQRGGMLQVVQAMLPFLSLVMQAVAIGLGDGVCKGDSPQHSGYLPAGPGEEYFYYLATSRSETPESDPVVIWLTGGPGCSSMLAMLTENGPCSVAGKGPSGWETKPNPWSWNEVANVVWIDQPVGVGYSTQGGAADLVGTEKEVAERMFSFLQNFYIKFPHFLSVPLYVTGESYGGHYVPAVAARIVQGQQDGVGTLLGMTIGNGEVDPSLQWSTKPTMAFTGGTGGSLHGGIVSEGVYEQMKQGLVTCEKDVSRCQQQPKPDNCMIAMMDCAIAEILPVRASGRNPYDLRKVCHSSLKSTDPATALCYNFTKETEFMNDPAVKRSMGALPERPWSTCNVTTMLPFLLSGDYLMNYREDVAAVLAAGVRVLVYAGDTDAQVDWLGCRLWVEHLPWPHQKEWLVAPKETVYLDGQAKGLQQSSHGLTFMQIFDAGHMVPADQPEFALAMLRDFINQPSTRTDIALSARSLAWSREQGQVLLVAVVALMVSIAAIVARRRASRCEERGYYLMI